MSSLRGRLQESTPTTELISFDHGMTETKMRYCDRIDAADAVFWDDY